LLCCVSMRHLNKKSQRMLVMHRAGRQIGYKKSSFWLYNGVNVNG
jgi:hypothetical protein